MHIGSFLSHGAALVVGVLAGGFIFRNNPFKSAKTLEEIDALASSLAAKAKAKLQKKG